MAKYDAARQSASNYARVSCAVLSGAAGLSACRQPIGESVFAGKPNAGIRATALESIAIRCLTRVNSDRDLEMNRFLSPTVGAFSRTASLRLNLTGGAPMLSSSSLAYLSLLRGPVGVIAGNVPERPDVRLIAILGYN